MTLKILINKVIKKILRSFGITSSYISKISNEAPWIYVSYIPEAIYFRFDDAYLNAHQSHREMKVIIKTFNEIGYNVYCSNFMNENIPLIKFDVIFGLEPGFIAACEQNPHALKIYYATGAYSGHQNSMIRKRTDEFNKKWHSNYPYQRLVQEREFLSKVDKILQIGSKYTIETYPLQIQNKITTIHQSSTMKVDFFSQDKDYSNRCDILWIGGGGEILKGLDLFLEALGNSKYYLHIVGNVCDEFREIFSKYQNVKYYGFLNVNSPNFVKICKKCNFLIYPSCTEGGMPGSVINSMYLGVIPIVSRWAAFDEISKYGYMLEDLSVTAIHKSLEWIESLSYNEIEEKSIQCAEYSRITYNLNRFADEFKNYMIKELHHE